MNSSLERIDNALGQYYTNCGRNHYYNENGHGKFIMFINNNELNENDVDEQLKDVENCLYIKMDEQFPLIHERKENENYSRNEKIFNVIKYCYKYGIPPNKKYASQQIPSSQIETLNNADHVDDQLDEINNELLTMEQKQNNITIERKHILSDEQKYKQIDNTIITPIHSISLSESSISIQYDPLSEITMSSNLESQLSSTDGSVIDATNNMENKLIINDKFIQDDNKRNQFSVTDIDGMLYSDCSDYHDCDSLLDTHCVLDIQQIFDEEAPYIHLYFENNNVNELSINKSSDIIKETNDHSTSYTKSNSKVTTYSGTYSSSDISNELQGNKENGSTDSNGDRNGSDGNQDRNNGDNGSRNNRRNNNDEHKDNKEKNDDNDSNDDDDEDEKGNSREIIKKRQKAIKQLREIIQEQQKIIEQYKEDQQRIMNVAQEMKRIYTGTKTEKNKTKNRKKKIENYCYQSDQKIITIPKQANKTLSAIIKEQIESVDSYFYMKNTISMQMQQYGIDNNNRTEIYINLDLHDKETNEMMYLYAKKNDRNKWKMETFMRTGEIEEKQKLPASSRSEFVSTSLMGKSLMSKLKAISGKYEWWNTPIVCRKDNKRRMTLSLRSDVFNHQIQKCSMDNVIIIPIIIFDNHNNKHWMEYVLPVQIEPNVYIGISFLLDNDDMHMKPTAIHLDPADIQRQHKLTQPHCQTDCPICTFLEKWKTNKIMTDLKIYKGHVGHVETELKSGMKHNQEKLEQLKKCMYQVFQINKHTLDTLAELEHDNDCKSPSASTMASVGIPSIFDTDCDSFIPSLNHNHLDNHEEILNNQRKSKNSRNKGREINGSYAKSPSILTTTSSSDTCFNSSTIFSNQTPTSTKTMSRISSMPMQNANTRGMAFNIGQFGGYNLSTNIYNETIAMQNINVPSFTLPQIANPTMNQFPVGIIPIPIHLPNINTTGMTMNNLSTNSSNMLPAPTILNGTTGMQQVGGPDALSTNIYNETPAMQNMNRTITMQQHCLYNQHTKTNGNNQNNDYQ